MYKSASIQFISIIEHKDVKCDMTISFFFIDIHYIVVPGAEGILNLQYFAAIFSLFALVLERPQFRLELLQFDLQDLEFVHFVLQFVHYFLQFVPFSISSFFVAMLRIANKM